MATAHLSDLLAVGLEELRPVVGFTVYARGPLFNFKGASAHSVEAFLARAEARLVWYADSSVPGVRRATPQLVRYPLKWLGETTSSHSPFTWTMWAADAADDAPSFMFQGHSIESGTDEYLSYLRVVFPSQTFQGNWSDAVAMAQELALDAPVQYGTAGLFFSQSLRPSRRDRSSVALYAAASRFCGIEVDRPELTSLDVVSEIKTINWLTLIHADFVLKLGGLERLRGKLDPMTTIHQLSHGVMIQAGEEPGWGDVNAGEVLPSIARLRASSGQFERRHIRLSDMRCTARSVREGRWTGCQDSIETTRSMQRAQPSERSPALGRALDSTKMRGSRWATWQS